MTVLDEIIQKKRERLVWKKQQQSLVALQAQVEQQKIPENNVFLSNILARINQNKAAVIAEIKRASPSQGVIRAQFDVPWLAVAYGASQAAALSVLTEEDFFGGSFQDLSQAKQACSLPILQKDFIVDVYQVYEACILGASCVLLICAVLSDRQLSEFAQVAQSLGLAVLIEVHSQSELQRALALETSLIGINNRDLRDFSVNLEAGISLLTQVPKDRIAVAESGICSREDVCQLWAAGVSAFLVGQVFMQSDAPGEVLDQMFGDLPLDIGDGGRG